MDIEFNLKASQDSIDQSAAASAAELDFFKLMSKYPDRADNFVKSPACPLFRESAAIIDSLPFRNKFTEAFAKDGVMLVCKVLSRDGIPNEEEVEEIQAILDCLKAMRKVRELAFPEEKKSEKV